MIGLRRLGDPHGALAAYQQEADAQASSWVERQLAAEFVALFSSAAALLMSFERPLVPDSKKIASFAPEGTA